MEAIFERRGGRDVHKGTLTACIIVSRNWKVKKKEIKTYTTMMEVIEKLRESLKEERVKRLTIIGKMNIKNGSEM